MSRERPRDGGPSPSRRVAGLPVPAWIALLLALHAGMVIPGILRNSITFDENFHLPAGVLYLARGYTHVSLAQPPLARALYALPVMPMHPALPPDSILAINAERDAGRSFLHLNAARFETIYRVARGVALLMSLAVGLLVFVLARGLWGPAAGLLALAAWCGSPEVVAQAGLVGMDLPTALVFLLVVMAFRGLVRRGRPLDVALLSLAWGAALLTRYSALMLVPVLIVLAAWAVFAKRAARPAWLIGGLAVALVAGVLVLDAGYLFQVSFLPMGERAVSSARFLAIKAALPWLRLPLPDAYIAGYDYLSYVTESVKPIYVLGGLRDNSVWWYFPLAAAVKWPLGWWGLMLALAAFGFRRLARPGWDAASVLLPAATVMAVAMASDLDYGLRYLLPMMPFLAVAAGRLAAPEGDHLAPAPGVARATSGAAASPGSAGARPRITARRGSKRPGARGAWATAAVVLVAAQALECALDTPWQLSHFNVFAGGRGDRIVNDSSVDWGQGLIALRDEMRRRGIERVNLSYHGTTDPALYGIDYVPYRGGTPDSSSAWLAVSSYYFVGLSQRMVTPAGDSPFLAIDFRSLWGMEPVARPGHCMYLFRLPAR